MKIALRGAVWTLIIAFGIAWALREFGVGHPGEPWLLCSWLRSSMPIFPLGHKEEYGT